MKDRFEIDFLDELDGQLESLARRASQKDDRVSKTGLRRVLLLAGAVAGLAALAAVLALTLSHTPKATSASVVVPQVPATIPPQGVTVANAVFLMPPPADAAPAVSQDQVAKSLEGPSAVLPSATVLASVTVPETVPTQADLAATAKEGLQWDPIQNRTAWVLTYTFPRPENVIRGGYAGPGAPSPSPVLMSHQVVIVDAQTGKVIFGFFTP